MRLDFPTALSPTIINLTRRGSSIVGTNSMEEDSPTGNSLRYSSGPVSPAQASRIEQAIKRYEDEIQNICRSNAQMRASIKSTASPLRVSQRSEDLTLRPVPDLRSPNEDVRKLQMKVKNLEDYVQTLEQRVRDSETPGVRRTREDPETMEEVAALRESVRAVNQENAVLKEQIEKLNRSLTLSEQRILYLSDHSTCESSKRELEETIRNLRLEISHETEAKSNFLSSTRALQTENQDLRQEYEDLRRSKSREFVFLQEKTAALEEEIRHYQTLANQRDEENNRMVKKLRDYVQESEEKESDLKYQLSVLESKKSLRNSRLHLRDLDEKPRRERSSKSQDGKDEENPRKSEKPNKSMKPGLKN